MSYICVQGVFLISEGRGSSPKSRGGLQHRQGLKLETSVGVAFRVQRTLGVKAEADSGGGGAQEKGTARYTVSLEFIQRRKVVINQTRGQDVF